MKRLLFFFIMVALSSHGNGQTITLVSWNLKDLGNSKNDIEIRFIAETLRNADIIAIQEVVAGDGGAKAMAKLVIELNTLGTSWDYAISDPTSSSTYKSERYAFAWKKSKLKLVGEPWLEKEYGLLIDREPYYATFSTNGKSFTVASFHAITKAKQPETEIKYFRYLPGNYPGLKLIFVGDFNLPQSHTVFNPLKRMGYISGLVNQKTSLRQEYMPDGCLASEYDNIYYNPSHLKVTEKGIIPFYDEVDTFKNARLISDHVPVYLKFSIIL